MITKATKMFALLDAQAASGQTIKSFCAEQDISPSRFHYWQKRRQQGAAGSESPVPPGVLHKVCRVSIVITEI